jgi:hypothetical protein
MVSMLCILAPLTKQQPETLDFAGFLAQNEPHLAKNQPL